MNKSYDEFKGMYTPFTLHSFRILVGSWLLATSVLVYGYCSIVVSALTVPTMKPPINNFEDLTTNLDVGLLVRGDMVVGQQILVQSFFLYLHVFPILRRDLT